MRFLPLFKENGNWIEQPNLMILAALAGKTLLDIQQIYGVFLLQERTDPFATEETTSEFTKKVVEKAMLSDLTKRRYAGEFATAFMMLDLHFGKAPTFACARRLVVHNRRQNDKHATEQSVDGHVKNAVKAYLPTLHFHAAAIYDPTLIQGLMYDQTDMLMFLSFARAFEDLFNENIKPPFDKWEPIRVPPHIQRVSIMEFRKFSDEQLRAVKTPIYKIG